MGPFAPWHVGSSRTRARTRVPCTGRQIPNHCATREALFLAPLCRGAQGEGIRAPLKGAPETGVSSSYQRRPQRRAWDTKAAAATTKKLVCKHRSLSTPPLPGSCAACHCQGPVIQGQLRRENAWRASGCCNVMVVSAAAGSPHIHIPPSPLPE